MAADKVGFTEGSGKNIATDTITATGDDMPVSKIHTGAAHVDGGPVTTANPFPVAQQGTVAVTQSGSWVGVGVTNANLDAPLSSILAALSGTLTVTFAGGQAATPFYSIPYDGTNIIGVTAHPFVVSGTVTLSGAVPAGSNTIGKVDQGTGGASAWKVDGSAATQPISAASLPLPSGAATAANQATEIVALASIDGKITVCNTGAVTVAASALPSGASTSAKQDTGNTSLASIDGKITTCNTGAVVVSSCALPSGASTSALQTSGNASLTSIDGKITACNTGAVTVAASALPSGAATESTLSTLNGKVTACNTGAVVVSSSALPSGAATAANQSTIATNTGNTATNTSTLAGTVSGGAVAIRDGGNSITVDSPGVPTSIGTLAASASTSVALGVPSYDKQATLATAGKSIKYGVSAALFIEGKNTTGGSIFIQIHDGTSQPSNGAQPLWYSTAALATGSFVSSALGHSTLGVPCATGVYLVLSSTQDTYTAIASTAFSYQIYFSP